MKNGQGVTGNIFKRIFNYVNTKRYETQTKNKEYKKNWDSVKWKVRIARFISIFGFYYIGKYFTNVNINKEENFERYMKLWEEISSKVTIELNKKNDFKTFFEELSDQLENFFKINLYNTEREIFSNKKSSFIYKIFKQMENSNIVLKVINVEKLLTKEEYASEPKEIKMKIE